jgi:hypothetical protein
MFFLSRAHASYAFMGSPGCLGLLITSGPDAGVIEFSIDGGDFRELDRITRWSRVLHLPWVLVVRTTDKAEGRMTTGSGAN